MTIGDQVIVEGAIQRNQFESILRGIYAQKEGHSLLRTAAVALLALPLIPLLAVYDLVRYGLFRYGYCNGKSWSLIDQTGVALQSLANRLNGVATPVVPEHPNAKSERLMREHVGKILDGYRKEQGDRPFDSAKAIAGEKQIVRHQHELAQVIAEYLSRNVSRCEEFGADLMTVLNHLHATFIEMAEDDIFIENKLERKGLRPSLHSVALRDLQAFLRGNPVLSQAYLSQVERDFAKDSGFQHFVENLKAGVAQTFITPAQAKEKMEEKASQLYIQTLEASDPKKAQTALEQFFQQAVNGKLFSPEVAKKVQENIEFSPQQLAAAVANSIVIQKARNPQMSSGMVDQKLANSAFWLKQQGKLDPHDEGLFLTEARSQLTAAEEKRKAQAELEAAQKAQAEAEAAEEAQKAEELAKLAAERQKLFDTLNGSLRSISEKQSELLHQYELYEKQATDKGEYLRVIQGILQTKVPVGKQQMPVFQAYEHCKKRMVAINASKKTPEEQMKESDQFNQDLGSEAVRMITQLRGLEEKVADINRSMSTTLAAIDQLDLQIGKELAAYRTLAKAEKTNLDPNQRKEITEKEKGIEVTQKDLEARYRKTHNLSPFVELPSRKAVSVG